MNYLKNIFQSRSEWFLAAAGAVISGAIVWIMVWGVASIARDIGASLGVPDDSNSGDNFQLEAAEKLDLRGLEEQ